MSTYQVLIGALIRQLINQVTGSTEIGQRILAQTHALLEQLAPEGSIQDSLLSEAVLDLQPKVRSTVMALIKKARAYEPTGEESTLYANFTPFSLGHTEDIPQTTKRSTTSRDPNEQGSVRETTQQARARLRTALAARRLLQAPDIEEGKDAVDLLDVALKFRKVAPYVAKGLVADVCETMLTVLYTEFKELPYKFTGPPPSMTLNTADDLPYEARESIEFLVLGISMAGYISSRLRLNELIENNEELHIGLAFVALSIEEDLRAKDYIPNLGMAGDDIDYNSLKAKGISDQDIAALRSEIISSSMNNGDYIVRRKFERLFLLRKLYGCAEKGIMDYVVTAIKSNPKSEVVYFRDDVVLQESINSMANSMVLSVLYHEFQLV